MVGERQQRSAIPAESKAAHAERMSQRRTERLAAGHLQKVDIPAPHCLCDPRAIGTEGRVKEALQLRQWYFQLLAGGGLEQTKDPRRFLRSCQQSEPSA